MTTTHDGGVAPLDRRAFLGVAVGSVAARMAIARAIAMPAAGPRYQAIAFDAFPIFDPRPVVALAERFFPGRGHELSNAWRVRQFEYQWLRALSGRYADFWRTTDDALAFAARALRLEVRPEQRDRLLGAWADLRAWPDVQPALTMLRHAGLRLAFVSNATAEMLENGIRRSGLDGLFDHVLSTDRIRTFKPDPRAYQMSVDAFRLPPSRIAFAAFAGWDAAGAKWFGHPTFWVNRMGLPAEELGVTPDGVTRDLAELVPLVLD